MNRYPSRQQVERIRQQYPAGTRIVLHSMQDPYVHIPPGSKGTVTYVDDMGQIGVQWDTGSSLSLIPGKDSFSKDSQPEKSKSKRSHDRER